MNKNLFYNAVADCKTAQDKANFVTLVASVEREDTPLDALTFAMEFYKQNDQYRKAESLANFTGIVDEEVETWKKERKQPKYEPRDYQCNYSIARLDEEMIEKIEEKTTRASQ